MHQRRVLTDFRFWQGLVAYQQSFPEQICSQPLNMHNYGRFGEVEYEFTISNADNVSKKVEAHGKGTRWEKY